MNLFRVFLFSWAIASLCFADECADQWDAWKQKYAGANPYTAFNKTSQWKFSPEEIAGVSTGKGTFKYPYKIPDDTDRSGTVTTEYAEIFDKEFFTRVGRLTAEGSERDQTIAAKIAYHLERAKRDEMTLAIVGQLHVVDVYALDRPDALFAMSPHTAKSRLGNADHRWLVATGILAQPKVAIDNDQKNIDINYVNRLLFYGPLIQQRLSGFRADNVLAATPLPNTHRIVMGDVHGIDHPEIIDALPSAACLSKLGIRRVRLLVEGFRAGESISVAQLVQMYAPLATKWEVSQPKTMELLRTLQDETYKRTLTAVKYPIQHALSTKVATYQAAGIPIEIHTVESDGQEATLLKQRFEIGKQQADLRLALRGGSSSLAYGVISLAEKIRAIDKALEALNPKPAATYGPEQR